MGSADFSQFVVTTADETACETSTLKARALSPHLPATFTGTSSNFWTLSSFADLSVFPSLICGSCPSGQGFAYSFLQIPPRDGHPCCSAMYFVVAYAYSGLAPVRARPWRANKNRSDKYFILSLRFSLSGDSGIRTRDLCVANAALSQLSYIPKFRLPDYYSRTANNCQVIVLRFSDKPITFWAV